MNKLEYRISLFILAACVAWGLFLFILSILNDFPLTFVVEKKNINRD